MRNPSLTSKPDSLLCSLCERNKFNPSSRDSKRCQSCGGRLGGAMLETLRSISGLPDALGRYACACGRPEIRFLPDGTFHCPACGSEVLSTDAPPSPVKLCEYSAAYWTGRQDGRFEDRASFADNANLARWENLSDRFDYNRGYRADSEARRARNSWNQDVHEGISSEELRDDLC